MKFRVSFRPAVSGLIHMKAHTNDRAVRAGLRMNIEFKECFLDGDGVWARDDSDMPNDRQKKTRKSSLAWAFRIF